MVGAVDELLLRSTRNPIITAEDMPYPVSSVFNPAAVTVDGETVLVLRVQDRRGVSHLTIARSADGEHEWRIDPRPMLEPDPEHYPEECFGIEDPRLTYLEELGVFVLAYTAYSDAGPLVSLALSEDLRSFERLGAVLPPENKDAALFPERIDGRWLMLHRPVTGSDRRGAHIWLAASPDLRHWSDHRVLLRAGHGAAWDANRIGASPPPLLTDRGWLVLYHGAGPSASGRIYRLGLALLDRERPDRVLRRSAEWLFAPREAYEQQGDVEHVVFPCGWIRDGDDLRIYYGAADTSVALARTRVSLLLEWLDNHCDPVSESSAAG